METAGKIGRLFIDCTNLSKRKTAKGAGKMKCATAGIWYLPLTRGEGEESLELEQARHVGKLWNIFTIAAAATRR